MKTNNNFSVLAGLMMLAATLVVSSCNTGDDGMGDAAMAEAMGSGYKSLSGSSGGDAPGSNGASEAGNTNAGMVTAGEWSDLDHWDFWSKLMTSESYAEKSNYWQCYTNNRVAIQVTSGDGHAAAGLPVKLVRVTDGKQTVIWEAVTDNRGLANCWLGLWQKSSEVDASTLRVSIDGQLMEEQPVISGWEPTGQLTVNRYTCPFSTTVINQNTDIAFVVDATGSMGDEINFLKSDLVDIISSVSSFQGIRTAALFYRDTNDVYLTRHSDFSSDINVTVGFVNQQSADGGGDYPEAVHTALESMLVDLSWDATARTRLAFLILDAPAHYQNDVISSLQQSVTACARRGIRLIPVAASGVDKNTEFMLRFFAVATGGTYVFLTDDSGVGNSHLEATVGDYEVELLNKLIVRLINYYTE